MESVMKVQLIPIKVKSRLNKLDSQDNPNLACEHIVEAFNKAQLDWVRRQLHGNNPSKQGDESSIKRVDDLQVLLTENKLRGINKKTYFETLNIPKDYLSYKRLTVIASSGKCVRKRFKVYLIEEGNVDAYLSNTNKRPSAEWAETIGTFLGNKVRIYTDDRFKVDEVLLTYYRKPTEISISGCSDIDDKITSSVDPDFKDDVVEVIIDETCSILSGDIESFNQHTRASGDVEENN